MPQSLRDFLHKVREMHFGICWGQYQVKLSESEYYKHCICTEWLGQMVTDNWMCQALTERVWHVTENLREVWWPTVNCPEGSGRRGCEAWRVWLTDSVGIDTSDWHKAAPPRDGVLGTSSSSGDLHTSVSVSGDWAECLTVVEDVASSLPGLVNDCSRRLLMFWQEQMAEEEVDMKVDTTETLDETRAEDWLQLRHR